MRPLWLEFPEDESTFTKDDEFLLGPSLLVHGVYAEVIRHCLCIMKICF